jgi:hypothetical protein
MNYIAQGKEAVLKHLEDEARQRSGGKEGQYLLAHDDYGNLVAFIAGHSFIGTGTIAFSGKNLTVSNGIVMDVS